MTDQHLKVTGHLVLDTMAFATGANMFALITLSDPVQMALIQAAFGFLTVTFGGVITLMLKRMERNVEQAKKAIVQTQEKMETLEKNTNSIKDELVRVTRSNALQEGETMGKEKADAKTQAKAEAKAEAAAAAPPAAPAAAPGVAPAPGQIPFSGASGTIELKATVHPPPKT